jgi:hypothetical protein
MRACRVVLARARQLGARLVNCHQCSGSAASGEWKQLQSEPTKEVRRVGPYSCSHSVPKYKHSSIFVIHVYSFVLLKNL